MSARRTSLTLLLLFAVVCAGVWVLVRQNVQPATGLAMHDGGAWLVNRARGTVAHANGAVFEIDARVALSDSDDTGPSPFENLDVVQANGQVIAHYGDQLIPLDTALLQPSGHVVDLPEGAVVESSGDRIAVFDLARGLAWRFPIDAFAEAFAVDEREPVVDLVATGSVTPAAHAVLGADSTVYFVSEKVVGADPSGEVFERALPVDVGSLLTVSAVGDQLVALTNDELVIVGPETSDAVTLTRSLADPVLQVPSEDRDDVVAGTSNGEVVSIAPATGAVTVWRDELGGGVLPPLRHEGCDYTYAVVVMEAVRLCDGETVGWPVAAGRTNPKLRLVNGRVWLDDLSTDSFASIPSGSEDLVEQVVPELEGAGGAGAPIAVSDEFAVNEGETLLVTAADLLANDTGQGLRVVGVSDAENATVTLDDGTVAFTPTGAAGDAASFVYTSRDDQGVEASARVVVQIRSGEGATDEGGEAFDSATAVPPPAPEVAVMGVSAEAAFVEFFTDQCVQARYEYRSVDGSDTGVHQPEFWPDANAQCWTTHGSHLGWWTPALVPNTEYSLTVTVVNRAGQASPPAVVGFTTPTEDGPADSYLVEPRVFANTCSSITIDVITDLPSSGTLSWLPGDGAGWTDLANPGTIHRQALGGLAPGTTYTFTLVLEHEELGPEEDRDPIQPRVFSGATLPSTQCGSVE